MNSVTFLWILFWALFLIVSALDYLVCSRRGIIGVKTALRWTGVWIGVALGFSGAVYALHPRGQHIFVEFISGYLTEYSLSVDNLFVFILIFNLMGVGENAQPKLIKLGIYLSIVLRIVFIVFGIAIIERFHWLIYVFGALLVWTAWKMLVSDEEDQVEPQNNLLYKFASRVLPLRSEEPHTTQLTVLYGGKRYITPLFLVFLVIGSTDVLFAIDSIPAIMGISRDPFVVLSSNIFAVLGLNSLFFAIRGVIGLFKYLKHGVSLILFFIGAKMIAGAYAPIDEWFEHHTYVSLLVIVVLLTVSMIISIAHDRMLRRRLAKDGAGPQP